MNAPTSQEILKAAYKTLYTTTANALDAQRHVILWRAALKEAEAAHIRTGATDAGKNAEQRAAILYELTLVPRSALAAAENDLAEAEREQALAKIAVAELRDLMRLAEWEHAVSYSGE